MSHTPGPWRVSGVEEVYGIGVLADGETIAAVSDRMPDGDPLTGEANACLIAAAPDLLAALADITERIRNGPWDLPALAQMHKVGYDAIAKATGDVSLPTPPVSGSGDPSLPETSHEEGRQAQDPSRTDRPR